MWLQQQQRQEDIKRQERLHQVKEHQNYILLLSMAQSQAAMAAAKVNIANALEAKKEKTTMVGRLVSKKQRCALIWGSTVDYNTEPTTVTASCERLYEASSHHASYAELQDLMMRSNATYRYSPTHLENTTKVGVI
jgi:hypothetical protein